MPVSLQLSAVRLRVADLARAHAFYTQRLGFVSVGAPPNESRLAVGADAPPVLTLTPAPGALTAPRDAAGLFHAALVLPDRPTLGAWLRFAESRGVEFDGFSDHGVSEAIYLTDPEGNGLEFYADKPRAAWPFAANGDLAMVTRPLAVREVLAQAKLPNSAAPLSGSRWGHLHLRVTELERSEEFYRAQLDLARTQGSYPGARFLAADGYHHHVAINTWGAPRRMQPVGALGLAGATFGRAGISTARDLVDPDGIRLRLEPLRG
ncbi:MAG: VOC family protein [Opitutaceae bacterium]|nr:VOC family protein [Opitutaceae bacterium]